MMFFAKAGFPTSWPDIQALGFLILTIFRLSKKSLTKDEYYLLKSNFVESANHYIIS
jgi:hypothetical protein